MPYAILLNELKPLDLQKTARILAKAENIVYADATRAVRNCCGILAQGLTFEEATSICRELNREGVGVFHMDQAKMYLPEAAVHVNNADCLADCFEVQDVYGRAHPLSWANIILLSLARVVEKKKTRAVLIMEETSHGEGELSSSSMGWKVVEEEDLILDIFSEEPQKKHYRIKQKAFNYDYLGGRLKPSSADNFRFLVQDLVGFASHAYGNRGINAYLSGDAVEKMNYSDLDHFDKENVWLLQLIHLGGSRGGQEAADEQRGAKGEGEEGER